MSPATETWLSNYRATQFVNYDGTIQANDKIIKQPILSFDEVNEVRTALGMLQLKETIC